MDTATTSATVAQEDSDQFRISGPEIVFAAGITCRKLDYWCRCGLVTPAVEANGSGSQRRFDVDQIAVVRIVAVLVQLQVDHDEIRAIVRSIEDSGTPVAGTVEPYPGVIVDLAAVAAAPPPQHHARPQYREQAHRFA